MATPLLFFVDAGVEKIHFRYCESGGTVRHEQSIFHHGRLATVLEPERAAWKGPLEGNGSLPEIYLSGKLSREAARILGGGTRFMQESVLFRAASCLFKDRSRADCATGSVAIIDFSASGYSMVAVGKNEDGNRPHLMKNPACGAGSGVNLRRVLDKLGIAVEEVDRVLATYLGPGAAALRSDLPVRTERCGVFSVSATVSDKNQGIPIAHALAVTMKSEAIKPCSRFPEGVRVAYLTGGVFRWRFMRDCAEDFLRTRGVEEILYDGEDTLFFRGMEELVRENAWDQRKGSFMTPRPSIALTASSEATKEKKDLPHLHQILPSFRTLRERLADAGRYVRLPDQEPHLPRGWHLMDRPVNIAMDMGSSMAKMVIADAVSGENLYRTGLPNRGDALQTVRHFFDILEEEGTGRLRVQNWGLTGSGRYQIAQVLKAVYPHLRDRILTMVENEAHCLGSLDLAERHIGALKRQGHRSLNEDIALLVDIGGEDTKISVISLKERVLVENAMNCKCSAGTGSLMDVLKDLLGIPDVTLAYRLAQEAEGARRVNATCAVFLMEEARKMQAQGIDVADIFASCCYSIVENMARSLWRQVNVLPNTVVLLHGQTMLSDPLALATIDRLEAHCRGPVYGLVPPDPGHRACYGLIGRMAPGLPLIEQYCEWNRLSEWRYERKLFHCSGRICGNERMRCTRTTLSSQQLGDPLTLTIGGCTTVNERPECQAGGWSQVPDAYREIWQWLESRHPQSKHPKRLVIPRCFSLTREAYQFAIVFERLGLPVHVDAMQEGDMSIGRPFFVLDTCAPNIGAAGQCIRLAGEDHGLIFLPQIDFMPTEGSSLGRACTTNQGGIWAAAQFARQVHPQARFLVAPINLGERDPLALTRQIYRSLGEVFAHYGIRIELPRFRTLWQEALEAQAALDGEKADLAAQYLEWAAESNTPVTIVCGREYVLNPGIYDNHISKMLKDRGILPVPSYAFDTPLDPRFAHIYWKTAHDIATKAAAIAEHRLHETVGHRRLKTALRRLEKERTASLLSHAVVTTFHCGPDSVTVPLMQELSKTAPSLWIQSDGAMAELAHLETRINTHLRLLKVARQVSHEKRYHLRIEALSDFNLDGLDPMTDMIYFPTMGDNRVLTSLVRAMGFMAVDNYTDDGYDLEQKGRLGRRYVGDAVCLPLAAVFGDMISCVEDFLAKKGKNDPVFQGKSRIVLFMHGGDGPCRLGQYIQVFKLIFCRLFGGAEIDSPAGGEVSTTRIRLLENVSSSLVNKNDCSGAFEPWVGILGYQGLVVQGLCHSLLLQAMARCRDEGDFRTLTADYRQLKQNIAAQIELRARPGRTGRELVRFVSRHWPVLAGPAKYLGYGLFHNFGLRGYFRSFAGRWIFPYRNRDRQDLRPFRIHLDGEVYMRTSQAETIMRLLTAYLGYGAFEMTLTPTWCFMEAVLYTRLLAAMDRWSDIDGERKADDGIAKDGRLAVEQNRQAHIAADAKRAIRQLRNLLARPLYAAGGVAMPHAMREVYRAAAPIIPTAKPYGELVPFVGEAVLRLREGADLILNVAPEGCMVSGMGDMLIPSILAQGQNGRKTVIVSLCSRDGEVQEEELRLALLTALGERWKGVLPTNAP